jgi:nucleoside-diphosphate-sugar epimerase
MKLAIVGASGFIGLRAVEWFTLGGRAEVRPVVRSYSSLAVLARQELDWRVADPLDARALAAAIEGCDVVLHAAIGDPVQIERMAAVAVEACRASRIGRLVWLSTAVVHGPAPGTGTDESTALRDDLASGYARAKVRAEQALAAAGDLAIVRLRPGIVFGPRSSWIAGAAQQVRAGTAWWIDGGRGVCNAIYVDNLLEAVRLACTEPRAVGEAFLVGDAEVVTWRDLLLPVATACGGGEQSFREVEPREIPPHWAPPALQRLTALAPIRAAALRVPDRFKRLVKSAVAAWPEPAPPRSAWTLPDSPAPSLGAEMGALLQCRWKLPHTKAGKLLGYRPPVSFAEGMRRSLAWLEWTR